MNAIWLAVAVVALYIFGWLWYSRFLAERIYRLDPRFTTPAHRYRDGVDFVPTNKWVLWGHHFTSVAGAAPIVGPAIAMYWGWGPALAWVALGTVFAAGVHDFGALVLSNRHRGQSVGTMANRLIGRRAKLLFLFIILILILMVNAVFAWVIANLFISNPAAVLPVVLQVPVAIWIGYMVLRRGGSLLVPSLIALVIMYGTAILTTHYEFLQIDLVRWFGGEGETTALFGLEATPASFLVWILVLLAYVYFASTLPVWKLLQPRDYINAQQLVVGLGILYLGLFVMQPEVTAPAYNTEATTSWFPLLFITIACGAISGFHGLVASGTSSKQLDKETDARTVGYLGALGEGTLALITIIAVATLFASTAEFTDSYSSFAAAGQAGVGNFVEGASQLAGGIGIPSDVAATIVALIIVCFAATTLDSAVRLLRYIIGELGTEYRIPNLTRRHVATSLAVGLTAFLVLVPDGGEGLGSGGYLLWPLFGTSNQLLAGITLMLISLWLYRKGRSPIPTLIPMVFLLAMTIWAMTEQVVLEWSGLREADAEWLLFGLGAVILGFAIWILLEAVRLFRSRDELEALRDPADEEPEREGRS
ncbi:MAG: carbon starvation protein A [Halorhodospira halophila]|uniref:carbon starvation CstA family protein n=1 Tax=Halorhodospira TaxID=85108 RepID=UPI00191272EB|nr:MULTISPECIES: carbon starvation protein A [Halorhodospira]MBK5936643.1 carbon starvation protein A [Halorhodospira halophila]MBK5944499.1 carbon starvation protein A [Halorhodospira halophila]MCC3750793.1 carbon starvation protein A [Halorhodospira halophila]MCG5538456.1 carbon starvation protein A [Halorhodospira sp. 9622]